MLVAAAFCPAAPLLVPEVAAGAAGELDQIRTACDEAVAGLLAQPLDLLVVVGSAAADREYASGMGYAAGFGVPVEVRWGSREPVDPPPRLPWSLTIGAWLLERQPALTVPRRALAVDRTKDPGRAWACGHDLAERAERVGMLVVGDGSARLSAKAPGYVHADAVAWQEELAAALGEGDVQVLGNLDAGRCDELMVEGRVPWQVAAGAAGHSSGIGPPLLTRLLASEAPYGVGYVVATWIRE